MLPLAAFCDFGFEIRTTPVGPASSATKAAVEQVLTPMTIALCVKHFQRDFISLILNEDLLSIADPNWGSVPTDVLKPIVDFVAFPRERTASLLS